VRRSDWHRVAPSDPLIGPADAEPPPFPVLPIAPAHRGPTDLPVEEKVVASAVASAPAPTISSLRHEPPAPDVSLQQPETDGRQSATSSLGRVIRQRPSRRIEPAALLAEHIAPALIRTRALTKLEAARMVAVPREQAHRRRADGRTPVGIDPPEVPAGEIHVHIDRIDVRPAAPASTPPPGAAAQPKVDHAEYLARQAARWGR
jgi:hypothetical protein